MNIPDEAAKRYPEDYKTIGGNADRRRSFAEGAAWARREALREARNAIASLGYVIDSDVTGFPSGQAIDRAQALAAIRSHGEGEQG